MQESLGGPVILRPGTLEAINLAVVPLAEGEIEAKVDVHGTTLGYRIIISRMSLLSLLENNVKCKYALTFLLGATWLLRQNSFFVAILLK